MTDQEEFQASVCARIEPMIANAKKYPHVAEYGLAAAFFEIVVKRVWEDVEFAHIVDAQLALFVNGTEDPDTRYYAPLPTLEVFNTMNATHHVIRNRLITWNIDHPEET